jgi:uncharacterized protein (TIGR00266 family)
MTTKILYQGSMPVVLASLEKGESMRAEAGAMVYKDITVDIEGKAQGGIAKGLGRMMTGESFFVSDLIAKRDSGKVMLAPTQIGNIVELNLTNGSSWILQKGAFLCSEPTVSTSVKSQGLGKGMFSGEGLFIIRAQGEGKLFISSFGAIHKLELNNEEIIVDNGHMVAWEDTLTYRIEKASQGLMSTFKSGEGLVARFKGTGTLYIQTRNFPGFVAHLGSINGSRGILSRIFG